MIIITADEIRYKIIQRFTTYEGETYKKFGMLFHFQRMRFNQSYLVHENSTNYLPKSRSMKITDDKGMATNQCRLYLVAARVVASSEVFVEKKNGAI